MKYLFFLSIAILIHSCSTASRYNRSQNNHEADILNTVSHKWLNTPYKYGGTSRKGIDCSGLTRNIYKEAFHYKLPRTSQEQYKQGQLVRINWIKSGDLIFFKKDRHSGLDHVGIYLGNEKFIHATTKRGVVISELNSSYYKSRIVGIRRYLR